MSPLLAGLLASWPGLVVGATTLSFRQEYFFQTYAIVSGAFLVLSFCLGARIPQQLVVGQSRRQITWLTFRNSTLAWIASLILLAILNQTSLCIGQDNGDGHNASIQCVVQTIAAMLVYTPLVLLLIGFSARVLAARLCPNDA